MKRIDLRLQQEAGLDASALGPRVLERTVQQQMQDHGLTRPEQYEHLLACSPSAWAQLIEALVVAETWFFRDPEAFAALAGLMCEEWLPAHPANAARLLSAPCSTGEEPYSMAMALFDAGVPADRFQIDALDISARALSAAHPASYGKHAFRNPDLRFRDRYFRSTPTGYGVARAVLRQVHFGSGNLVNGDSLQGRGRYDVVFCRNLLIYLTPAAQRRVLENVRNVLAPNGVLFVGPAELALAFEAGFVSAPIPQAFACRQAAGAPAAANPPCRPAQTTEWPTQFQPGLPNASASASVEHPARLDVMAGPEPMAALPGRLAAASRLANAGRLAEAAALCEAHLSQAGASAYAYYLLGLLRDAAGDATALECYRKALYLEPKHQQTLLQMALLAQRNGDLAGARNFRRRAERARAAE
jgi:chemotaxis protein methyltransferase WspC